VSDLKIQLATFEDFDEIVRVWRESWLSTGLAEPGDPDVPQLKARIASRDSKNWKIYIANSRDGILGFIVFEFEKRWVRQLFVRPPDQGRGVGTGLLNIAKAEMPDGFWLRTDVLNLPTRRFYEERAMHLDREGLHSDTGKLMATYVWP
jgi:GNAT superfamily N-acetyltransferase